MTTSVLIANRGEIAVRIQRTARSLGLRTVAVHASDDALGLHVLEADESVLLSGSGAAAYLDIDEVVAAAVRTGCELLHPGYGFLSENPRLARRCEEAGIGFVGPTAPALELFADKIACRDLAAAEGVPVLAASGILVGDEDAGRFLGGLPVGVQAMVKALAGGGGRGTRIVRDPADVANEVRRARSESLRAFGDDRVYLEQYLQNARHVEIQVLGDGQTAAVLGSRDCSVQRRQQKVVELAPAPGLPATLRRGLAEHARSLTVAAGIRGVATVEFLLDVDRELSPFFIEANPRLQVEHGITEAITGLDLVALQFEVACGRSIAELGLADDVVERGFAIEARITQVETSVGTIESFVPPTGDGIRVDSHLHTGYAPPVGYDPLLAKVMAFDGASLDAAVSSLAHALDETVIEGVPTDIAEVREVLNQSGLPAGKLTTSWWTRHFDSQPTDAGRREGAPGDLTAPVTGLILEMMVSAGEAIRSGQPLAVIEAMKMEHEIVADVTGTVVATHVHEGQHVRMGDLVVSLAGIAERPVSAEPDSVGPRKDLTEINERHRRVTDDARPEALERRHARGKRTARENVADLVMDGTFREYGALVIAAQRTRRSVEDLERDTPADGLVAGFGALQGSITTTVAVLAYDYTVLAGTQGLQSHKKAERIFELAGRRRTPLVVFAEGGGGRPGDVDNMAKATGMDLATFVALGRLNGVVPTVAVVSGRCFAGNAALAGMCDVLIATSDASIGMGGPAMVEGGGLGRFSPEEIGPAVSQHANGVVDVLVDDEAEATRSARKYLDYFTGDSAAWTCGDQGSLRDVVPEPRRRAFDIRVLIDTLCDTGTVMELRAGFGQAAITVLARIEGRAIGLVANDARHLGGAIDAAAADKIARFLQLCDAHGLAIVSLCDTPGFLVGPEAEDQATLRHVSRLFTVAPNLNVPLCCVIVRKAYGMGGQAMAGGGFRVPDAIIAWPTAEIGAMGPEGAVRLGYRRELGQINDEAERQQRYETLLEEYVSAGRAVNAASVFELDDVIDPADTRQWVVLSMNSYDWTARATRPRRIDTW